MTLADDLKPLARSIRGIPGQLGLRPHRVFLVTGSWGGDDIGDGAVQIESTELLEGDAAAGWRPPKVRQLNDERLALSNLAAGSLEVGPITSSSVTAETLRGVDLLDKQTFRVRIEGPLGAAYYRVAKTNLDRAIHWTMTLAPLGHDTQ